MPIATINPATGQTLKTFEALWTPRSTASWGLRRRHFRSTAGSPFGGAGQTHAARRGDPGGQKRDVRAHDDHGNMGKTFRSAVDEAVKCAWVCRFYAENGEAFLADEVVNTPATRSYVRYQPLGAVLAVMPWNYPFWQVIRAAAPILTGGNVMLLGQARFQRPAVRPDDRRALPRSRIPRGRLPNAADRRQQSGSRPGRRSGGRRHTHGQRRRRRAGGPVCFEESKEAGTRTGRAAIPLS